MFDEKFFWFFDLSLFQNWQTYKDQLRYVRDDLSTNLDGVYYQSFAKITHMCHVSHTKKYWTSLRIQLKEFLCQASLDFCIQIVDFVTQSNAQSYRRRTFKGQVALSSYISGFKKL